MHFKSKGRPCVLVVTPVRMLDGVHPPIRAGPCRSCCMHPGRARRADQTGRDGTCQFQWLSIDASPLSGGIPVTTSTSAQSPASNLKWRLLPTFWATTKARRRGKDWAFCSWGNRPLWEQKPCWTMLQDHPCYDSAGYAVMTTVNALEAERTAVRYGPHLAYMVL